MTYINMPIFLYVCMLVLAGTQYEFREVPSNAQLLEGCRPNFILLRSSPLVRNHEPLDRDRTDGPIPTYTHTPYVRNFTPYVQIYTH
jgi:hypothetical protein